MPLKFEFVSYCDPDTTMALPVMLGLVDPASELARRTMAAIEKLWNQRWPGGCCGRYDVSAEPDSPGPWPFATLFVMRAYAGRGDWEKVWRGVDWLLNVQGGRAGTWFELVRVLRGATPRLRSPRRATCPETRPGS
jgi:GH15 family glucan-1,4-alpha-glucosidase